MKNNICIWCGKRCARWGFRNNKLQSKQRYSCSECKGTFVPNDVSFHKKFTENVILLAIDLHLKGYSLREIRKLIWEKKGIWVNHVSISNWVQQHDKKKILPENLKTKEHDICAS